jgi:geranylgeranyl reductase family protein
MVGTPFTQSIYDVVIVGAGAAGGLLAWELAGAGLQTLVLEKKRLPRYKACGGGLTLRAKRQLPFDIEPLIEDSADAARLLVNGQTVYAKRFPNPVVHMVMRAKFDQHLMKLALSRGAHLAQQTRFLSFTDSGTHRKILTSVGSVKARILVGADGVRSRVARALDLPVRFRLMTALEAELEVADPDGLCGYRNRFDFDFGTVRKGYGWVFPKQRHLSAGILTRLAKAPFIRDDFRRYLIAKGLAHASIRTLRVHPIPYAPGPKNRYAAAAGLVVGDATGMVDPITGEGLYYAFLTARLAAEILTDHFARGKPLQRYTPLLRHRIGRELQHAQWLAELLYRFPILSYPLLKRYGGLIAHKHLEVFAGTVSYRQLARYVFSLKALKDLWLASRAHDTKLAV